MAKTEIILECHKCGAGFDVTDMKPDSRFRCENCRAFLKVPRQSRRGLFIGMAAVVIVVAAAVILLVMSSGTENEDRSPPKKTATRKKAPKRPAPEKPKVDLVQLEYEDMVVRAGKGRTRDLLKLAKFCRQHEVRRQGREGLSKGSGQGPGEQGGPRWHGPGLPGRHARPEDLA